MAPFLGGMVTVALWLILAEVPSLFGLPAIQLSSGWRWGGAIVFSLDAVITLFWSLSILAVSDREKTYALTGPYAYLRHPIYGALLYSGTAGVAFASSAWPVLLAVIPLSIMWTYIANREESVFLGIYGKEYQLYMQNTGQLFPRLTSFSRKRDDDPDSPTGQ